MKASCDKRVRGLSLLFCSLISVGTTYFVINSNNEEEVLVDSQAVRSKNHSNRRYSKSIFANSNGYFNTDVWYELPLAQDSEISILLGEDSPAQAVIENVERSSTSGHITSIGGTVTAPERGRFLIHRDHSNQTIGFVRFDTNATAYQLVSSENGLEFETCSVTDLMCAEIDQTNPHLASIGLRGPEIAASSSRSDDDDDDKDDDDKDDEVVKLCSDPNATAVVYLDFDGSSGNHIGWGSHYVSHSGLSNKQIKEIWERVSENYSAFTLNITTDPEAFEAAPMNQRIRCIVGESKSVLGDKSGLAYKGSFNWNLDSPCWAQPLSGENGAQLISHEVGHTLGLSHDGNSYKSYYEGHSAGFLSWGPIMGAAFGKNITHWSKGEYKGADNQEDDIEIIATQNNGVSLRVDQVSDTFEEAQPLEALTSDSLQGFIETSDDIDIYKVSVMSGKFKLTAENAQYGANLDIELKLFDAEGKLVAQHSPETVLTASLNIKLEKGVYYLQVDGVGVGEPSKGYSDYSSIGSYAFTGSFTELLDLDQDGIEDLREGDEDSDNDGIPNYKDLDSDNDGAPDLVEEMYSRNVYFDDTSATDSDGDGYSDTIEMITGNNPDSQDDNPHITSYYGPGQGCVVEFYANKGCIYTILESSDLKSWTVVEEIQVSEDNTLVTHTHSLIEEKTVFFKLEPRSFN